MSGKGGRVGLRGGEGRSTRRRGGRVVRGRLLVGVVRLRVLSEVVGRGDWLRCEIVGRHRVLKKIVEK